MTPLEACLGISGSFEGGDGGPRYTLLAGNADGCGISVGALQWNPGTGSIQKLLALTFGAMAPIDNRFETIHAMLGMKAQAAKNYAIQTFIKPGDARGSLTDEAKALWTDFLQTEECHRAQVQLAQAILDKAEDEASHYLPWMSEPNDRIAAFFFDLRVQQGGMSKRMDDGSYQTVDALADPSQAMPSNAIDFAARSGKAKTGVAWQGVVDSGDTLASVLLHYAYERASMSRPQYMWDTLSRRGTIACRTGTVHGTQYDLTPVLP